MWILRRGPLRAVLNLIHHLLCAVAINLLIVSVSVTRPHRKDFVSPSPPPASHGARWHIVNTFTPSICFRCCSLPGEGLIFGPIFMCLEIRNQVTDSKDG